METVLDINEIKRILPHRYPFLLVDKVLRLAENQIAAVKNVTINEPFFQGHFPQEPIMPGVLQVEAMAQTAGIWAIKRKGLDSNTSVYFMTIDKVKFRKPVRPGDVLHLKVEIVKTSGSRITFQGNAYVEGALVSEAFMMAMIADGKSNK